MEKIDRKEFLSTSLKAAVGAFIAAPAMAHMHPDPTDPQAEFTFTQIPLPYPYEALEPAIDRMTMEIHYTKHHAAYVKNVAAAITEEGISVGNAEDFFAKCSTLSAKARNNGGGAWNHNLFWQVMRPAQENNAPVGRVRDALNGVFGTFENFKQGFTDAGMKRFGSGWAWLVLRDGELELGSTSNQDNPLMDGSELRGTPLLALDVWEHAYYLKYQNKRNEYIENWWSVVNWDEVAARFG